MTHCGRYCRVLASISLTMLAACGDDVPPADDGAATGTDGGTQGDGTADAGETEQSLPEGHARIVHSFGVTNLAPAEEIQPCIQWTLNNDEPVYINRVSMANNGGYHHSNWFVVPETYVPGDDGFFSCAERGFSELEAALAGTVLTAQSTQSRFESMQLPEGVVVKVPPRHKTVAGGHLLNLSNDSFATELRMELELIHPKMVTVVTTPFRLSYTGLNIPPLGESRFSGDCDIKTIYESQSEGPLDLKLYYVLPHYHYLGNYFDLSVLGGARDGESVFRLDGFNADGNGGALNPPLDLSGAEGFSFTCGYDNWRDVNIGWGIGDQEMCVMLGLADSKVLMDASVAAGTVVGNDGEILLNSGECGVIGLPPNAAQGMPTQAEIDGEMYVPPSEEAGLPIVDMCADIGPESAGPEEATLSNIRARLFVPSCEFSSCHAGSSAVGGLDFRAEDLHAELMGHTLSVTKSDMPLIDPGNPDNSYLYQAIAHCDPAGDGSEPHMPLNAAELVHAKTAALVRGWIERGAPND
ncbi:MAG: hypothetical protein JKY37_15770 [Nannocystaceae bacterium]|nr:hypothetical protein [Nannocystaceae bacterium]